MCYVHNQWYDISCAILYIPYDKLFTNFVGTAVKKEERGTSNTMFDPH